ncbi:MAG TPA: NAD(P)-dependent oxidoreductase [Saprospiraceae bacterium]|nr:NAD(P)-dependent oxidoreductase [Saprospiraceae bacterium]
MSEFKPPSTEADFESNFAQIKPLMNETEAYYESSRCLFCYDAPCVNACPTGIDIPLFIRQINSENIFGAAKTIFDSNYFGHACGKVCPTEVLCEGACVYNHSDVKPIEIGRLQSYATDKAIVAEKMFYTLAPENGKKVAVIGAGPAGISCACELRLHGFEVDIFDSKSMPSGLTMHGVAPYKISNEDVLDEMAYLEKQFGYRLFHNTTILAKEDIDQLQRNYDAIFLGVGLGKTAELNIPGEDLDNVYGAVEFIEELKIHHHFVNVPKKVIVLGGGNTAMDAASECARMGAESVILAYRRSKEEMGAYDFEYDLAKSVGVKGIFNVSPVEIGRRETSDVSGVRFIRTITENGQVSNIPGSEFVEECDMVIKATGQSKQTSFLNHIGGIGTNPNGTIQVNEVFQTTNKKYFAAGDAVSGGQEVVNAVADGKKAAKGIISWLQKY